MASITAGGEATGATLRGILLMTLAVFMFSCLDATAKWLGQTMPPLELTWLRFFTHVILLFLLLRAWQRIEMLKPANIPMQTLRALCMCGATGFNFAALQYLQLAQTVAIMFAAPLLVTALSGPILGEWAGPRRWAAVIVGFVGVVLVTRPGVGEVHWAMALSFAAMTSYTFYILLTRRLGASESSTTLLMWPALVGSVGFAPLALSDFVRPEPATLWLLVPLLGVFGAFGHYVLIIAHKLTSPNVLAPFAYTQMIWMILLGFVLFGDLPDGWTLAGTAIISASGLYILHRERLKAKEAARAEAAAR